MSMTKRHFIQLANVIRGYNANPLQNSFTPAQVEELADFCENQNPRFNRERWLDYIAGLCGPSGGKVKKAEL